MRVAIIGAGWAGMAAAVQATQTGHHAIVFEAAHAIGGRARALNGTLPDGSEVVLDNGQHILIGAYRDTLRLMRLVGVDPAEVLLRLPLVLRFPDGTGLQLPAWPAPLDALAGILRARGWSLLDKASLLRVAAGWQRQGFVCDEAVSVAQLCRHLRPNVMNGLIEPLCVSALNTPADQASGRVFLRVLKDSLFGGAGSSNLLLPRVDLSALFPQAAAHWLIERGGQMRLGTRVVSITANVLPSGGATTGGWRVNDEAFDAVILATPVSEANRLLASTAQDAPAPLAQAVAHWQSLANSLRFEAITTVYAWGPGAALPLPMMTLPSQTQAPAQFVFDRGQLGGPPGLLAFVVSASSGERAQIQAQVLAQAHSQLGLHLQALQTVVEKRATFACTPGLKRPPAQIAPGLLACGDYVDGPYPATLEGAVRSGLAAANRAY